MIPPWRQVLIHFDAWNTAEHIAATHLAPVLADAENTGLIASWFFIRKALCWRVRFLPTHDTTAVAQLRSVLPLLSAQMAPEVRPRLYLATASLATTAGWISFEVKQHDAARRLWMVGLDVARAADHPQGSDLAVFLLHDMALQAVHLGRPDEALRLVHIGHAVAAGPHPVSPSTTCKLVNVQALAHAAQGEAADCEQTLGKAEEHFSSIDPATIPAWCAYLDEIRLASFQGDAYYELALTSRDPHAAGRAVPLLRHAADHFDPNYARLQTSSLTKLAGPTRSLGTPTPLSPSATRPSTRSPRCTLPGRTTDCVSWTPCWNPCTPAPVSPSSGAAWPPPPRRREQLREGLRPRKQLRGVAMGEDDKPNKHDGDRDGQGVYQPDKTETPKDYGRGKHEEDDPDKDD